LARWREELGWLAVVLVAGALTGAVTVFSIQLGCTVVLVVLALGAWVRSRAAGLVVVGLTWLLVPELRRVLGVLSADPLALAPFLSTGALVALELARSRLSRAARRILLAATLGYLVGVPSGLISPTAMLFGLIAALVGVGAFVLGYREPVGEGRLILPRVLVVSLVPLAAYGLAQWLLPLAPWDQEWLRTTKFITAMSPVPGKPRVFSTLNSPGTFAMLLGMGVVAHLGLRRLGPVRVAGLALVLAALALTYVRSAWVALAGAAVVMVLVTRGRLLGRVGLVVALLALGYAVLAAGSPTGRALVSRVDTFAALDQDTSAQQRLATPQAIIPLVITSPVGRGIGQAGEASRLSATRGFRYTDNGYLSLLYQLGPVGALLVLGALGAGLVAAARNARRRAHPTDVMVLGLLVYAMVAMFAGELLFGITGVLVWYAAGVAVRRGEPDPAS